MKVLLIGQNMAIYNPTSLTESFYRSFTNNNVSCDRYDLSYYIKNKYFNYVVKKIPPLRALIMNEPNDRLIKFLNLNHYTHLFIVKGTFLLPDTLVKVKETHPTLKICCFNPDNPFISESWGGSNHSNIRDAIPYYDHYFIWSKQLMNKIKETGDVQTHYLSFAVDSKLIKKFDKTSFKYDLSFIGNSDVERRKWISRSADLIDKYSTIDHIDIFGLYWKQHNNISLNGGKFGDNYFRVFSESKININILRSQNKNETNMRTFEIPATGNFMLHEESEGAKNFFEADVDAVYFNSPEELLDKAQYYLKNEALRFKIAQSGYEKSLRSGYTYDDKLKQVIKTISK